MIVSKITVTGHEVNVIFTGMQYIFHNAYFGLLAVQLVKGSHGSKLEDTGLFRALCLAVRLAARLIAPLRPECTHGGKIGAERKRQRNEQQKQRGKCPHPRDEQ